MPYDRFMIAPINSGLQSDLKSFMIPEDAFARLDNAYVFRGRVRKRFGERPLNVNVDDHLQQQHTRLRMAIPGAVTDAAGRIGEAPFDPLVFVPLGGAVTSGYVGAIGQMFSIGDTYFTVINAAAGLQTTLSSNPLEAGFYDVTTGQVAFQTVQPPGVQLYFYPSAPVMGFAEYQVAHLNNNPTYAFDTKFAYEYTLGAWDRLGTALWSGNNLNFFWSCTWHDQFDYTNLLFVTNYNEADRIKYYNIATATWTTMTNLRIGPTNATNWYLRTCRILLVYKNRLIALNTVEDVGAGPQTYVNRARWARNGDPTDVNAAWLTAPGAGDWLDAPTKEAIITAQILKDRLIVFFESSTWELVYTGNEINNFRWQNINSELGAESTFSQVSFDKVILGVGNVGIMACNAANVERIDEKIPDSIFKIHQANDGPLRVAGIRDFYVEMTYWAFPSNQGYPPADTPLYPNKVLVYNYRTGTWAFNDDAITAFGYYYQQAALTWSIRDQWITMSDTWGTGQISANPKQIIAGNQQGFTFLIDTDRPKNAISLQITNIDPATSTFTVLNHTLEPNSWVLAENCNGVTLTDGVNAQTIFQVSGDAISTNTFVLNGCVVAGIYTGGGTITRVSRIDIITKQYNLYLDKGRNAYIAKVDFLVNREPQHVDAQLNPVPSAQITVDASPSYSDLSLIAYGQASGSLLGTNVLELTPYASKPLEQNQEQFWHPIYFQAEGEAVQFELTLSDAQMQDPNISINDFQLNAFTIYATPTASRLE